MSKIELDYEAAHTFVKDQRKIGSDTRWDGWNIVIWKFNPNGFSDKRGAFRKGRWGMQTTITPDKSGVWHVPTRYIKNVTIR